MSHCACELSPQQATLVWLRASSRLIAQLWLKLVAMNLMCGSLGGTLFNLRRLRPKHDTAFLFLLMTIHVFDSPRDWNRIADEIASLDSEINPSKTLSFLIGYFIYSLS